MMLVEFVVRPLHFLIFFLFFTSAGWDSPMPLSQLFDNMKHDIKAPPMSCVCLSFFFSLPFFLPYISYDYHWCCCWLLLFCRQSTTVSLGYLVVSLCAEVRCWLGQDKTVGGRQWKKSFWVVWLLRSGRGKYLECRLNGCAGEAPRCGEGTLKSNFFPFLSESRSLTVRCACVRACVLEEYSWRQMGVVPFLSIRILCSYSTFFVTCDSEFCPTTHSPALPYS